MLFVVLRGVVVVVEAWLSFPRYVLFYLNIYPLVHVVLTLYCGEYVGVVGSAELEDFLLDFFSLFCCGCWHVSSGSGVGYQEVCQSSRGCRLCVHHLPSFVSRREGFDETFGYLLEDVARLL